MDYSQEEIDKFRQNEWNKLIKRIAKDCKICEGLTFIPVPGTRSVNPCSSCYPKAKTITYLKESGMNVDDIKNGHVHDMSLLDKKALFIVGESKERLNLGFGILKEKAKLQKRVFYTELSDLLHELRKGNRDICQYDCIFIDGIDMYREIDKYLLAWFDGVMFTFKNKQEKSIVVGGKETSDGYAIRFLETFGVKCETHFI